MTGGIYIGVDLGGTNVRAGAITPAGVLLASQTAPIDALAGPEAGLGKIAGLIEAVSAAATGRPLLGIGIGSTGPLDLERGAIQNPYTLPGWEDVSIVAPLQERFGVPVALENDADAAALGEAWMGAGGGAQRLMMVTIGTGVGTGLVIDGRIYRGVGNAHPEGGHILLLPGGPECYCGARGCWESLVAGPSIARTACEHPRLKSSALYTLCEGDLERIDAALVFAAARQGDPLANELVDQTATFIGLGLVTIMMLTLPDCIILTGGVLRSYDLMEGRIQAVIARHNVIIPAGQVRLRLAALGQQAGMFGAARAAQLLAGSID